MLVLCIMPRKAISSLVCKYVHKCMCTATVLSYVWPQYCLPGGSACLATHFIPLSCPSLTQGPPAAGNQDVVDDFLKRKQQAAVYRARALGQDQPSAPHRQWPQAARVGGGGARPIGQGALGPAAPPAPVWRNKAEKVCGGWSLTMRVRHFGV